MLKSAKFWDKISTNYDKNVNNTYSQTYCDTIENTKKYLKSSDVVLDFACGTGIITTEVSTSVKQIYAIDISTKMIEIAKNKCLNKHISNVQYDTVTIFDDRLKNESYDVILAFNVLCYMKEYRKAIKRIKQLLKPGGFFISATDCEKSKLKLPILRRYFLSMLGRNPFIKRFKPSELEYGIKKQGFKIIEAKNLYDTPPNYFIVARK